MNPVKNLLIFADGHVEGIEGPLVGPRYVRPEFIDGAWWERVFEVDVVYSGHDPEIWSMIGKERAIVRSTVMGNFEPSVKKKPEKE